MHEFITIDFPCILEHISSLDGLHSLDAKLG